MKIPETLRILEFRAENFMRLVAVNIRPDGNLIEITGKNGQGKSSTLNGIWAVFAGKAACPAVPIRRGCEEARLEADCGEIIVTRTFRVADGGDYTTNVTVATADGARFPSPQTFLDRFIGELSFDPLAFARMKPEEQLEALKRFVPDIDFAAIARADLGDRERRRELNRFFEQERGAAQAIVTPPGTPEEPLDVEALIAELNNAGEHNAKVERERAAINGVADRIDQAERRANELKARAAELKKQMDALLRDAEHTNREAALLRKEAEALPKASAPIDTADVRTRIQVAQAVNANVRKLTERMEHHTRATNLAKEVDTITARIARRQTEKAAAIAAAKMPIGGLGFADDHVLLHGLPFSQASDAEQLRVSVAIAVALNPKLRVIRVRDGSLLDEDSLALLGAMADANDMQVWIERVDSSGKIGFVLEDGHVRHPDKTADAAA